MKAKLLSVGIIFLLLFFTNISYSQILKFNFIGINGDEESVNSIYHDTLNIAQSSITRGPGINASSKKDRFNSTNWSENSFLDTDDYIEFTITPLEERKFSVSSIELIHQRTATGPKSFALRSSIDNFIDNLDTFSVVDTTIKLNDSFSAFSLSELDEAVTFRIYGYNAEGTSGAWGPGVYAGDHIIVNGVAEPLPVELSSFTASTMSNSVMLSWITQTEIQNYGFEIERTAADKNNWQKIGFVNGNGNTNSPKNYSFMDKNLKNGKYSYRLKQLDIDGKFEFSGEVEAVVFAPVEFSLMHNYPNPFNPSTNISYSIPVEGKVKLGVFNLLGQQVAMLVDEYKTSGEYTAVFDAEGLSSGIYFYKLEAGGLTKVKKMTLLR